MSKKKSAFLKEENLLTLLSQNNFIVPEIQREYVWGENEKVILNFLLGLKDKVGVCCSNCNLPNSGNKINIGFLYSYKPDYVKIEHDRFLDENLIDGQQRFTTLFLLLFYCSLKENRKNDFLTLIRFEEKLKMGFDFKVRDLTKNFLLELIEKINTKEQIEKIEKQTWFLKDYENDVSIKSMIKTLGYIQKVFYGDTKYYNHFINYIVFWHFKTEATSQGEELYITMNARGEELAENEVAKAAFMINDSDLHQSGKKWEEWQHFFWKNRNKKDNNPSADKGFNAFLSCIAGLEFYLKDKAGIKAEKDSQKLLNLEKVEDYYRAFASLIDNKNNFIENYKYCDWIDKCLTEIWDIINNSKTDWFIDYTDKNKSTERNRMVFIWSWLYYITETIRQKKQIQFNELYRVLRFFYVRYHNYNRSVSTLKMTIDGILDNGIWETIYQNSNIESENNEDETDTKFRTVEEIKKYVFLKSQINNADFSQIEELIWEIEDHPLNLDGSYVGNINISHLLDLNDLLSVDKLEKIKNNFNTLLPKGEKKGTKILKSLLLHYGVFWKDTSYYYNRYDFSDWKQNIRKFEFKKLINDLQDKKTETLLHELNDAFLIKHSEEILNSFIALPENSLRIQLICYSMLLGYSNLWSNEEKIIICEDIKSSRLFKNENKKIYKSKGSFKGYSGNTDLWTLIDDPLEKLKNKAITIKLNLEA